MFSWLLFLLGLYKSFRFCDTRLSPKENFYVTFYSFVPYMALTLVMMFAVTFMFPITFLTLNSPETLNNPTVIFGTVGNALGFVFMGSIIILFIIAIFMILKSHDKIKLLRIGITRRKLK